MREVRIKIGNKLIQMIIRLIKDFGAAMISQTGIKVSKDVTLCTSTSVTSLAGEISFYGSGCTL